MKIQAINNTYTFKGFNKNYQTSVKNAESRPYETSSLNAIANYNLAFCGRPKIPVYLIDKNGEYEKFDTTSDAARKIGLNPESTLTAIGKRGALIKDGYAVVKADIIENKDLKGNVSVNKILINDYTLEARETLISGFYLINQDGTYKKYKDSKEAASELGLYSGDVANCAAGRAKTTKGYAFVRACDVESLDDDFNIVLDEDKIKEFAKVKYTNEQNLKANKKPVYTIDKKGKFKRYESLSDATSETKVPISTASKCLKLKKPKVGMGGYIFVYAYRLEHEDKNGEIVVDKKKIKELSKNADFTKQVSEAKKTDKKAETSGADKKPKTSYADKYENVRIYAMKTNGDFETFYGISAAEEALGIEKKFIKASLNNGEGVEGYVFSSDYDK